MESSLIDKIRLDSAWYQAIITSPKVGIEKPQVRGYSKEGNHLIFVSLITLY